MQSTIVSLAAGSASPAAGAHGHEVRLAIHDVSLRYGGNPGVLALDKISFNVPRNQFCVIVGPSGCGKSSLLYLAAGLNEVTSGTIRVNGQIVYRPGADRGMVFQSYTLFPWLTVRGNVEYGLKRKGMASPQRAEITERYLKEIGLAGFASHYPSQLSGGMQQRVAIARALANDPAVLLMDEPFGALDSQTRSSMQQLLLDIWERRHKTVLFVTHDIDEALVLADRIVVMTPRPGRIKADLTVELPRPRSVEMTMEPSFLALKRHIYHLLHDRETEAARQTTAADGH